MSISTQTEWARNGTKFFCQTRADKDERLPGGLYRYEVNMSGWWLDRYSAEFEFPFKVYAASTDIIARITKFWTTNRGNVGVLMNGLRGAGKTMTAQLLANSLIKERNLPILVVKEPVPLQLIFDSIQQDMMVIFDEFEKTHDKPHQQEILSAIDGMARSKNARLIIFTTNNPTMDENFKDRPSRIHYNFEFQRVADEVIEGLINDGLPADLMHFKQDIFDFLHTRYICTIDIVRAVIAEVKTFRESPLQFEGMLNISKGEPPSFTVDIINEKTGAKVKTVSHFFKSDDSRWTSLLTGSKKSVEDFIDNGRPIMVSYNRHDGNVVLNLLEKCKEDKCWLAQIAVPKSDTPFGEFSQLYDNGYALWMDNRPKDWKFPFTYSNVKEDPQKLTELTDRYNESCAQETVYGTGEKAIFKIRIEANRTPPPSRWQVTGELASDGV